MSEILEIVFDIALNTIGCVLELFLDGWLSDVNFPDTKGSRIFLGVVIAIIAIIVFWELR